MKLRVAKKVLDSPRRYQRYRRSTLKRADVRYAKAIGWHKRGVGEFYGVLGTLKSMRNSLELLLETARLFPTPTHTTHAVMTPEVFAALKSQADVCHGPASFGSLPFEVLEMPNALKKCFDLMDAGQRPKLFHAPTPEASPSHEQ